MKELKLKAGFTLSEVDNKKVIEKLEKLGLTLDEYVQGLVKKDVNSIVQLDNGFYFNLAKNKLFNSYNEIIKLTRIEEALFSLLLDNRTNIVAIEKIHEIAWKGKNMTRFTLRNKIKTLRDKTYYDLIKNHSNIGYSMN